MRELNLKHTATIYQVSSDDLMSAIKNVTEESFKEVVISSILNKFNGIKVSSAVVCEILGITNQTLSTYIKYDVVKPLNPGSSKLEFDLRTIIEMPNPKYRRVSK